jgi:hypothetical protein
MIAINLESSLSEGQIILSPKPMYGNAACKIIPSSMAKPLRASKP